MSQPRRKQLDDRLEEEAGLPGLLQDECAACWPHACDCGYWDEYARREEPHEENR